MDIAKRIQVAKDKFEAGEPYSTSTSIDEDTILAGYGKLEYDDFEFPLPISIIVQEFGGLSWDDYFAEKGYYRWKTTNKTNGQISLLGRFTEQDIEEMKLIEGNESFNFERI